MAYFLGFLISAVVVALVAAPLFRERRSWAALAPHTRRAVLLEERDAVLRELKDLEFDRRMGKIDDDDYAELHATTARRATAVLDALEALQPTGRGSNGSAKAAWHRTLATDLNAEAEILVARARLRLRGTPDSVGNGAPKPEKTEVETWLCQCGRVMKSSDKFCGSCGAARPQV